MTQRQQYTVEEVESPLDSSYVFVVTIYPEFDETPDEMKALLEEMFRDQNLYAKVETK
jgi:hypothetical protein